MTSQSKLPPAFVISLAGETQRRTRAQEHMNKHDIPFAFFDAIDGRGFDAANHPAYNKRRRLYFGKDLTGGEIGCLLSHRGIMEKMIAENLDAVLVFEDDVILSDDFIPVVQALYASQYPYDLVRFLGSPKVSKLRQRKLTEIHSPYHLTRLSTTPGGAHAYLIRKNGAEKLLKHMERNIFPVDTLMGRTWQTNVDCLTIQPGLAIQDLSLESSIGEKRFEKKARPAGLAGVFYPLTRAWFKFSEMCGKNWIYWSRYMGDKKREKLYRP